jgi:hypothetical protein
MENLNKSEILFAVLIYATKKGAYFSKVERIFINQERGQLMANETAIENELEIPYPKLFKSSKGLKAKIDFVVVKIQNEEKIQNEILQQMKEVLK